MSNIIHYFSGCCGGLEPFAIASGTTTPPWSGFQQIIGKPYGLVIGSYSGCVGYSGSSTTNLGYSFRAGTPYFYPYESCSFCTKWIYPCNTPPVVIPPTIVGYKNECGIVTILPMGIQCVTSNATTSDSYDGEVSLEITGGTPPYTYRWNTGQSSPTLTVPESGTYTLQLKDAKGCVQEKEFVVNLPLPLAIALTITTVPLCD